MPLPRFAVALASTLLLYNLERVSIDGVTLTYGAVGTSIVLFSFSLPC